LNCSLDLFHKMIREASSNIDFHSHEAFELVYYISGTGTTQIQKELFNYSKGQFAIIPPGFLHNEFRHSETEVIFFVFSYDNTPIYLDSGLYSDSNGHIHALLEKMGLELKSKSSFYDVKLQCILMEIIIEIGRMTGAVSRREANDRLTYAKNYIEQYYSEKIDLPGLAITLGYCYDYFRHQFKETIGFSPMQYVIRQRIDQAKQILLNSDRQITDISMECGFSTTPQFCLMFKRQVGISPKRYRDVNR